MQTIWITGGSSGIGFSVAKKFINENWRVIISSRNENNLEEAIKKIEEETNKKNIFAIKCDVSKYEDVKKTINEIEKNIAPIDIALLNAAAYSPNKTQDFDIKNYELLIEVNLNGTLNCIDVLKEFMKNRNNHIAIVS